MSSITIHLQCALCYCVGGATTIWLLAQFSLQSLYYNKANSIQSVLYNFTWQRILLFTKDFISHCSESQQKLKPPLNCLRSPLVATIWWFRRLESTQLVGCKQPFHFQYHYVGSLIWCFQFPFQHSNVLLEPLSLLRHLVFEPLVLAWWCLSSHCSHVQYNTQLSKNCSFERCRETTRCQPRSHSLCRKKSCPLNALMKTTLHRKNNKSRSK